MDWEPDHIGPQSRVPGVPPAGVLGGWQGVPGSQQGCRGNQEAVGG